MLTKVSVKRTVLRGQKSCTLYRENMKIGSFISLSVNVNETTQDAVIPVRITNIGRFISSNDRGCRDTGVLTYC